MRIQTLRSQEPGAQIRGHQLAGGHDPRARAVAQFTHQRHPGADLPKLLELPFKRALTGI